MIKEQEEVRDLKMLDWMMERLRIKDGKHLGNVAINRKRWKEKEPA